MPDITYQTTDELRDTVRQYLARGWAVVPIAPGSKRPTADDWVSRKFVVEDFESPSNIGVKLGNQSNWLVDLDCDTLAAAQIAYRNMPNVLNHGRLGRPHSHYWFTAPEAKAESFIGLGGKVIVEVRSTGQQTVLPPSVHTSGETLAWDRPDASTGTASVEQIHKIAAEIAATVLIAENWPSGSRHFAAAALGGFLYRLGFESMMIGTFVRNVVWLAKDEEPEDRVRAAQETADKMASNASTPTTGAPKLIELLTNGAEVVNRVREWYGAGNDEALEELNAKHFVVRIGKDVVVGVEPSGLEKIDFMPFDNFNKLYYNRSVGKKKLGLWWLEHPRCRKYDRVVMAPPGAPGLITERDYNLWRGFAHEPMPISHQPDQYIRKYLAHVFSVIAKNNKEHTDLILDLLADCVQRPGQPIGRALALRGPQGAGKSMFVESFGKLFGGGFISVSHRESLVGKFNAHLASKIVVFADEAVWGGNRQDVGVLKHMTTQRTFEVQPKGIDIMFIPNFMHLFLATNEEWAWPAGNKERRGILLDVLDMQDPEYFDALWAEVEAPEFGPALLAYLLDRPVDYLRLRTARVNSEAMREQQIFSSGPVQQWWADVLNHGEITSGEPWPEFAIIDELYAHYVEAMGSSRGAGHSHRGTRMVFTKALQRLLPGGTHPHRRRMRVVEKVYGGSALITHRQCSVLRLPRIEDARKCYDEVAGYAQDWMALDPEESNPSLLDTEVEV